jgi:hypothetical protein
VSVDNLGLEASFFASPRLTITIRCLQRSNLQKVAHTATFCGFGPPASPDPPAGRRSE